MYSQAFIRKFNLETLSVTKEGSSTPGECEMGGKGKLNPAEWVILIISETI